MTKTKKMEIDDRTTIATALWLMARNEDAIVREGNLTDEVRAYHNSVASRCRRLAQDFEDLENTVKLTKPTVY